MPDSRRGELSGLERIRTSDPALQPGLHVFKFDQLLAFRMAVWGCSQTARFASPIAEHLPFVA